MPRMAVSPLGQNVRKTMTERTRERGKWSLTKDTPKESTTIGTKLPKNNYQNLFSQLLKICRSVVPKSLKTRIIYFWPVAILAVLVWPFDPLTKVLNLHRGNEPTIFGTSFKGKSPFTCIIKNLLEWSPYLDSSNF
jgi:hypothetical protein